MKTKAELLVLVEKCLYEEYVRTIELALSKYIPSSYDGVCILSPETGETYSLGHYQKGIFSLKSYYIVLYVIPADFDFSLSILFTAKEIAQLQDLNLGASPEEFANKHTNTSYEERAFAVLESRFIDEVDELYSNAVKQVNELFENEFFEE